MSVRWTMLAGVHGGLLPRLLRVALGTVDSWNGRLGRLHPDPGTSLGRAMGIDICATDLPLLLPLLAVRLTETRKLKS